MAREIIIIGCKLPHGLIMQSPADPKIQVRLNGLKDSKIIGSTFATTEVDREFWDLWKLSYLDYAPLKSGAIFEAKNQDDAKAKGKELAKKKTGFEGLPKEAQGVKPADKD